MLAVLSAATAGGVADRPDEAALERFAERFLSLVGEQSAETFRDAADLARVRSDAREFQKLIQSSGATGDDRLIEEWLAAFEPLGESSWEHAEVLKAFPAKDGVSKVRLRLKSAEGEQTDCLVSLVEENGERWLTDVQRLPAGARLARRVQWALGNESTKALADWIDAIDAGQAGDPRSDFARRKDLSVPALEPHRDRVLLAWASAEGRSREALRRSARLRDGYAEDPAVAWHTARAHFRLERHADVARCLEWYESLAGADGWSNLLRAKSLEQQGRFAEARRASIHALKDDPTLAEAAVELFKATPGPAKAQAASLLPTDAALEAVAMTLGSALSEAGDVEGLKAAVDHAERHQAPDDIAAYLRGELLLAQGKANDAAEAVSRHLPQADDEPEDADDLLDLFCDAMHRAGRAQEAYRKSATPRKALLSLTDKLDDKSDAPLFKQLATEHVKRFPDDAVAVDCLARFHLRRKEFAEAGRVLDAFLKHPEVQESDACSGLGALRVKAFLGERKVRDAASFIGADEKLFAAAAAELADEGRASDLETLLTAFAPRTENGVLFAHWHAELACLKKDYGLALAYLRASAEGGGGKLDDRRRLLLVRVLVRSGLRVGVDRAASNVLEPGDELGFALAAAVAGDSSKLEDALEDCLEAGYAAEELLEDPDLGPLLESPPLVKVRDKVLVDRDLNP